MKVEGDLTIQNRSSALCLFLPHQHLWISDQMDFDADADADVDIGTAWQDPDLSWGVLNFNRGFAP